MKILFYHLLKTNRLIVIDEANPRCSIATDIAAIVADKGFDLLDAPIKRITAPHTPVPFSPPLEKLYLPTPEKVIETVSEMIETNLYYMCNKTMRRRETHGCRSCNAEVRYGDERRYYYELEY